jgi:hypothetical protein
MSNEEDNYSDTAKFFDGPVNDVEQATRENFESNCDNIANQTLGRLRIIVLMSNKKNVALFIHSLLLILFAASPFVHYGFVVAISIFSYFWITIRLGLRLIPERILFYDWIARNTIGELRCFTVSFMVFSVISGVLIGPTSGYLRLLFIVLCVYSSVFGMVSTMAIHVKNVSRNVHESVISPQDCSESMQELLLSLGQTQLVARLDIDRKYRDVVVDFIKSKSVSCSIVVTPSGEVNSKLCDQRFVEFRNADNVVVYNGSVICHAIPLQWSVDIKFSPPVVVKDLTEAFQQYVVAKTSAV